MRPGTDSASGPRGKAQLSVLQSRYCWPQGSKTSTRAIRSEERMVAGTLSACATESATSGGSTFRGGSGGDGIIFGDRGTVIGGKGGRGGTGGSGGHGGSGTVFGDDGVVIGGDGADAGGEDGRAGRGARGPTERYGFDTSMWGFGRGG